MKVIVDKDKCIGCGACVAVAAQTFMLADDGKSEVIEPLKDDEQIIKEAVESCPVGAIKVE